MKKELRLIAFMGLLLFSNSEVFSQKDGVGIFEGQSDIGPVKQQGAAVYNDEREEYEIRCPGVKVETNEDPFHFIWKHIKGDFIIDAQVELTEQDTISTTRVGCMIRSQLDENSTNLDAYVNGKGLTSVGFRRNQADTSSEIACPVKFADIIEVERNGNTYIIRTAKFGQSFVTEQVADLTLGDEVYAGLFISSEDKNLIRKGIYHNVRITIPVPKILSLYRTDIGSNIEILDIETGNRKIIYTDTNSIHSPIWSKDGKTLIYGKQGNLYTFDLANKISQLLHTGRMPNNSNDHVLSPDGKMVAFCIPLKESGPVIYTVSLKGGEPKQINKRGPCYPHCWSPDGKTLLFSASRKGEAEIYKVSVREGKEYGITNTPGMDDGPEYSPDGKYIYFTSNRTGAMRVWRMKPDGSDPEVVTTGEFHDWFPHISPDGKWIVFLSYSKDDASSSGHPSYRHVYLRLMPVSGGQPRVIAYLYGGQGTINSPCWSPDSKKIAFASFSDTQY